MKSHEKKHKSTPHFKPRDKYPAPPDVNLDKKKTSIKARLWIERQNETYLSFARITLLERIEEYGSITGAAQSMGISYRHAWKLVDSMNRLSYEPLINARTGGKGGGGARLTEHGEKTLRVFRELQDRLKDFLDDSTPLIQSLTG